MKNTRNSQSLCSPSWDRVKNDLDDVFDRDNSEKARVKRVEPSSQNVPIHSDHLVSKELIRIPTRQTNGNNAVNANVEHLSSALSSLMKANGSDGRVSDTPSEKSSDFLEDTSLQDFEVIGTCEEATEATAAVTSNNVEAALYPSYVRSGVRPSLPSPDVLGCGNPFLIFLCLTVLLQHRDSIVNRSLDSNEMAMHFDRLVRKHNVERVLSQARTLYYRYLGHFNPPNS